MYGDGSKWLRGRIWWVRYYGPGKEGEPKRISESTGSTDERDADRLLRQRRREVENHRAGLRHFVSPRSARVTMNELFDDVQADYARRGLKSQRGARNHMRRPRLYLGSRPAVAVTASVIDAYIDERKAEGLSIATIDRETEFIRRAFTLGKQKEKVAFSPPIPKLLKKHGNARQGFIDPADFKAILSLISDEDFRDGLWWFYYTGMRTGEFCSLTWDDYDATTGVIRLPQRESKTGRPRTITINGPLVDLFERRIQRRTLGTPLIFHSLGRRMNATSSGEPNGFQARLWKMWHEAAAKAGHEGRVPYDLRRTAVRNLSRSGSNDAVAMSISGHLTNDTFRRYNITDERDIADAFDNLGAWLGAKPKERTVVAFRRADGHKTGTK